MATRVRRILAERLPELTRQAANALDAHEAVAFAARFELGFADLYESLGVVYGPEHDLDGLVDTFVGIALRAAADRPSELRDQDRRREIDPGWFQRASMIGYVAYVDRFAGRLPDVAKHLDYLAELGVTFLHLMPLLEPRAGENDGGYAVRDYRAVDPRLGTMTELEELARELRERRISLCLDVVINHTAREHPWARAWAAGDPDYAEFYLSFPDRTMPDAYEASLPEVFPETAPGSFSWDDAAGGWVWTTFHDYQWDLNYANPRVFAAMLDTILYLANRGVDVLRLDAVPFTWKRLGTDCQNQPEAHALLQALRALVRMAAPAVIFQAEAIVAPDRLVGYLGAHERYRPECDLAYNNQLMVLLWSSLATQDAPLMTGSLQRLPEAPPPTGWVTYLRCHADIGWAVSDDNAAAVGWSGPAHRRFLVDFFAGRYPGSYAAGAPFQENPVTGDARTSGTAAALCGIDRARRSGDPDDLDRAIRRLLLLYSVVFSYGGIPLIYMGDEIALPNDAGYLDDPVRREDNRWMHRPPMDWPATGRRHDPTTVEGRVFAGIAGLARCRRALPALRSGGESVPLPTDNPRLFGYRRRHPRSGPFAALVNFAATPQSVAADALGVAGLREAELALSSDGPVDLRDGRITLPGLGYLWLVEH